MAVTSQRQSSGPESAPIKDVPQGENTTTHLEPYYEEEGQRQLPNQDPQQALLLLGVSRNPKAKQGQ